MAGLKRSLRAFALGAAVFAAGCSEDSPLDPGPVEPPPIAAPVITSVVAGVGRVEVDDEVTITAQVNPGDGASPLTYQWSATVGTVTGTGPSVTWRLAPGAAETPANVVVSLTVIKPYQALVNGQLVSREHRVTAQAAPFRVHDSEAEVSAMALHFLIDLFGDSRMSADQCLVDFWPACPGRDLEHTDIVNNRDTRFITAVEAEVDRVSFNAEMTTGNLRVPCTFYDINRATNEPETWTGNCRFDVVYQDARWWLCSSLFTDRVQLQSVPEAGPSGPQSVAAYWRTAPRQNHE